MQTSIRKPVLYGLGLVVLLFSLAMSAYWFYWTYGDLVLRPHSAVAHDKLAAAVRASDEKAIKSLMAENFEVRLRIGTTPYDSALMSHCFGRPKALMGLLREMPSASEIYTAEAAARDGLAEWMDARGLWVAVPDTLDPTHRGVDGVSNPYVFLIGLGDTDSYDEGGLFFVLASANGIEPYKLTRVTLAFSDEQVAQSFAAKAAAWCGITPDLDAGYEQQV